MKGYVHRRVPRLFDELALARAEGSYARVLARLAKADLLILDDWALGGAQRETQRHDLLEVLEDRYGSASTIITSQLEVKKWHEWIGDPTIADGILDRVVHNPTSSRSLVLRGGRRRRPHRAEYLRRPTSLRSDHVPRSR